MRAGARSGTLVGVMTSQAQSPAQLALRIETAEAEQTDRTPVAARGGVAALRLAGGRALFLGPRSTLSVAIGVGLAGPVTRDDVDRLEAHLGQGGGAVRVELTPFTHPSLADELARRGYRVERFYQVWWRPLGPGPLAPEVEVRERRDDEARAWARLFFHAFAERPAASQAELEPSLALTRTPGNACFLALEDGEPRGVGVASLTAGVALLTCDGVPPPYRGRGLQRALIAGRLVWAAAHGAQLAAATTDPGGASQRSYERSGFRAAYPKVVMVRGAP